MQQPLPPAPAPGIRSLEGPQWLIPDLAWIVLSFLPLDAIAAVRATGSRCAGLLESDAVCRAVLREPALQQRVWAPSAVPALCAAGCYADALRELCVDSARSWITEQQLCNFEWYLHFKRRAGSHWQEMMADAPPPMLRFVGVPHFVLLRVDSAAWDSATLHWRFVDRPGSPPGSWVRIANYPTLRVTRHENGGFLMQSLWLIYSSFMPLALSPNGEEEKEEEVDEHQFMEVALHRAGVAIPDSLDDVRVAFAALPLSMQTLTPSDLELY